MAGYRKRKINPMLAMLIIFEGVGLVVVSIILIFVLSGSNKDKNGDKDESKDKYTVEQKGDDTFREQDVAVRPEELSSDGVDYSKKKNWAFRSDNENEVDVFYVAPTSVQGDEGDLVFDIEDSEDREQFKGTVGIQKGIYDDRANFYAPYYRQMKLIGYYEDKVSLEDREVLLENAYRDVKDAFNEYMKECNGGRKVVLAGFSQGSDMLKRLMMDDDFSLGRDGQLVAAYVIGWNVTDKDVKRLKKNGIKMAEGESDTGCLISFCSEAEDINETVMVPDKTNGINPLNWSTGSERVDKHYNEGCCKEIGWDSQIKDEITHRCGAYLDEERGTLKVTDVTPEEFYPDMGFSKPGDYHVWDYRFFYRNLEKNVQKRIGIALGINPEVLDDYCVRSEAQSVTDYEEVLEEEQRQREIEEENRKKKEKEAAEAAQRAAEPESVQGPEGGVQQPETALPPAQGVEQPALQNEITQPAPVNEAPQPVQNIDPNIPIEEQGRAEPGTQEYESLVEVKRQRDAADEERQRIEAERQNNG